MGSKSLRPPIRSILLPALIGGVLAVIATIVASKVVAPAIAAKGGWSSRYDRSFVGMCGAAFFFIGFFVSNRLMRGPRRDERSWMLSLEQVVPSATSYREAAAPSVSDLVGRLQAKGYTLETGRVDEAGAPVAGGDDRDPLPGTAVELVDRRAGARVVLRVSQRAAGEGGGLGMVTAIERGGKRASEELALFAIVELAALLPGLKYKDTDSALQPDDTEMLRASLPDRPAAL
ncbi:MAG TPA: hypothetical protein VIG06_16925 [Kofleriaceae bacterium]|jgi:hypothetical protein